MALLQWASFCSRYNTKWPEMMKKHSLQLIKHQCETEPTIFRHKIGHTPALTRMRQAMQAFEEEPISRRLGFYRLLLGRAWAISFWLWLLIHWSRTQLSYVSKPYELLRQRLSWKPMSNWFFIRSKLVDDCISVSFQFCRQTTSDLFNVRDIMHLLKDDSEMCRWEAMGSFKRSWMAFWAWELLEGRRGWPWRIGGWVMCLLAPPMQLPTASMARDLLSLPPSTLLWETGPLSITH